MERLASDVMLPQQALIPSETLQQLPFREPAATLTWEKRSWHAFGAYHDAVGAWERAIASELAPVTANTCEHSLRIGGGRSRSGCLLGLRGRV